MKLAHCLICSSQSPMTLQEEAEILIDSITEAELKASCGPMRVTDAVVTIKSGAKFYITANVVRKDPHHGQCGA